MLGEWTIALRHAFKPHVSCGLTLLANAQIGRAFRECSHERAYDFANVEYTLCYWLPYPIGVGLLLVISVVWISVYDWRMGIAMFGMPSLSCRQPRDPIGGTQRPAHLRSL